MYSSIVDTLTETGKLEDIYVYMLNRDPSVVLSLSILLLKMAELFMLTF